MVWEFIFQEGAGMLLRALRLSTLVVLGWVTLGVQAQAATYLFSGPGTSAPLGVGNNYSATFGFPNPPLLGDPPLSCGDFTHDDLGHLTSLRSSRLQAGQLECLFPSPAPLQNES